MDRRTSYVRACVAALVIAATAGVSWRATALLARADTQGSPRGLGSPEAHVAVRSGDPAPVTAQVPGEFGVRLGITSFGDVVFLDSFGSALFVKSGSAVRILAYTGEALPGIGVIGGLYESTVAPDGAVVVHAGLAGGLQVILEVPSGGGPAAVLLSTGSTVHGSGGLSTISSMYGPVVDGAGRVAVTALLANATMALVRVAPGGSPEILIGTGDRLGPGTVSKMIASPAVNATGTIAFAAELLDGEQVISTWTDGSAPVVLMTVPGRGSAFPAELAQTPPGINAQGIVAFLWFDILAQAVRLQRVAGGGSETIAGTGSPAPGGGTFSPIFGIPPVIDPAGGVIFAAIRPDGRAGLYRHLDATEVVAEDGSESVDGSVFTDVYGGSWSGAPTVGTDGTILFAAVDTIGHGLFTRNDAKLSALARAGDPLGEPARFTGFRDFGAPHLAVGPFLSPGGLMIFDASLTSGLGGLFLRTPDGTIIPVVIAGGVEPDGGGLLVGSFRFHSVNDAGLVAYVNEAWNGVGLPDLFLAYGPAIGPRVRLIGSGDHVPDSDAVVVDLMQPSRINAAGAIAIPVYLSDGTDALLGWDGKQLFHFAGPGDSLPDQGVIRTVSPGPDVFLPPLLDDAGIVTFGAMMTDGLVAVYEAPLRPGGLASARRLLGDGDVVPGGTLTPFSLQALDRDAAGRLAFQSVPAPATSFATFLAEAASTVVVAATGDTVDGAGTVRSVMPRLAFAGKGRLVHEFAPVPYPEDDGWLAVRVPNPAPAPPGTASTFLLAGPGLPSPDGGVYINIGRILGVWEKPPSDRLASDGRRFVAVDRWTTAGPQEIVLFDLDPGHAPVADAGRDQVVECGGPAGTEVALDGRGSSDPDGDALTFDWSGPFGTAVGPTPVVMLPPGPSAITLTVRDPGGAVSTDALTVVVRDTLPPTFRALAIPDRLWPPDGRMVPISVSLSIVDVCDPQPSVVLTDITITDPRGADRSNDVSGAAIGADDRGFLVRARRSGGAGGRTYTATYRSVDHSGNATTASATVLVPPSAAR